ncbi:MAG: glycoside hydrolase [Chitinophaga sp.]
MKTLSIIGIAFLAAFCGKGSSPDPGPGGSACMYLGVDTCKEKAAQKVTIQLQNTKQTIHSFGASDCWTTKYIGAWGNTAKKDQVADYLFSMDTTADGSPKGIGLSLWRFNIGAGSREQGVASNITDEWRREECFLTPSGTYDWSKQQGAQWFLQAAKQRGVKYTLGFSLSAPVQYTLNGKAFNGSGGTMMNIQAGKMADYADFLATVTKHFGFDYLSPVNEPQWAWGNGNTANQEGTQATNDQVAELSRLTSQKLAGTHSRIVVGEAGTLEFLYGKNTDNRGDQISQFFSPSSTHYLGDQPNVAKIISGHSYFTTCPDNTLINTRTQLLNKARQVDADLQLWQTEFGILGNICDQYNGSPRNTGIEYGLYVAKVLHHDLVIAGVTSWQWWLAVSPYNYSDALVYINDPSGQMNVGNCKTDGIVLDSKQLWCFGNFARFIRPGMQRVETSVEGNNDPAIAAATLMISAYKSEADKQFVAVLVNPESKEKYIQLSGVSISGNTLDQYTTSATLNCKRSTAEADRITIPAKSVVTVRGKYQ